MMDNRHTKKIVSPNKKNNSAIIGFILALAGLISCGLTTVPAFALCVIGVRREKHKKFAWVGLVVSCVGFCILLLPCACLLLFLSIPSRSFGNEFSKYGVDTRWQKYTEINKDPVKEIDLLTHILPILRFSVSADRQKGLYAAPSKRRGNWAWAVHLVDLNSGNHLLTIEHPTDVQCLAFSPSGRKAISGGGDGTVRLWDLSNGEQIACVKAHAKYARCVAYSPVEEKALSGDDLGEILLWDMEKMEVIRRFVGHSSGIRASLAWARDGKTFLSGSWDGSVRLWDVQTGEEIAHLQPGYGRVMSLALSPDGKYALSSYLSGPDQPVIFWNLETQKEINRFGVPGNPWYADQQLHVASVAFLPDGKTALFGLVFGTVIWWDLNKWELIAINRLHQRELEFVACSADGKTAISVGTDAKTDRNAKVKFCRLSSFQPIELPPKTIKLKVDDKMNIDLIYIEPSSFIMGSDDFLWWKSGDEGLQRKVTITKGFYIGKYKVTCAQFCKFLNMIDNPQDYMKLNKYARIEMKDGAYVPREDCENCAINVVHWDGAVAFCDWLSNQTGAIVRLPTEAEWEFTARGCEGRRYPWGWGREEWIEWKEKDSQKYPHPWSCASVDAFPKNVTPEGVVGMAGNVGEWCSDFYGVRYLKNDVIDPQGPTEEELSDKTLTPYDKKYHVLRHCEPITTKRNFGDEVGDSGIYGFRIVVVQQKD